MLSAVFCYSNEYVFYLFYYHNFFVFSFFKSTKFEHRVCICVGTKIAHQ